MTNSNIFNILNSYYEVLGNTGYLKFAETGCLFIFCNVIDMINDKELNWLFDHDIDYLRKIESVLFTLEDVSTLINIGTPAFLERPFM